MSWEVLAAYISQYVEPQPTPVVEFVWHGGEPTGDRERRRQNGTDRQGECKMRVTKKRFSIGVGLGIASLSPQPAEAQQTTGTPGAPNATTTIDGRYLSSYSVARPQKLEKK